MKNLYLVLCKLTTLRLIGFFSQKFLQSQLIIFLTGIIVIFVGKNVAKSMTILQKAKHFVDDDAILTIYYSIIYSYFTFCIEICGNAYKPDTFFLFAKPKNIVRIICNAN